MCNQCQMVNINGVNCHEHGCPNTGNKTTLCVGCGERGMIRKMISNEWGAGYVCADCLEKGWNN